MKSARANLVTAGTSASEKTPVQVFCRVRPMHSDRDLSCIEIKPSTVVVLKAPPVMSGYRMNVNKETHYVFKHVFPESSTQRDVYTSVGEPLVEDLIRGKDGLLFTYGVTGSGKTFTMTGDHKNRGIMQRCLDALFKTISGYQSKKFVFKPDRLNGFDLQSEADAMLERQAEMNSRFAKPRRQDSDSDLESQASSNTKILNGVDEDNMFAVFITYIEVYNNNVYDLLEEGSIQRTLQSKIIREDSAHNMYVHGVTEIEVKSFEEAVDVFRTGQKRKRMGHTILNAESSRSHSVFNIRLIQAPTDMNGENVIQDKNMICISQLSLVDLAGSERSSRTKNSGQRLHEAGKINNSLMTLRTCLEYLRENQMTGMKKKIPFRDSKITHMFKKYFEGEGQVNMIVCINPRAEDYDETSCVLKFAEMSQDVQTIKSTPAKFDLGLTPGRRKAKILRLAENDLDMPRVRKVDFNPGLIYSLGSKFPDYNVNALEGENFYLELMQHLRHRIDKRVVLLKDFNARSDDFRSRLLQMEKENINLRTELSSANAMLNQERSQSVAIKNKAIVYENSLDELNRKLAEREEQIKALQRQLNLKQCLINHNQIENLRQKKKYTTKMAMETDKINKKFENRLREQESKQSEAMRVKDEKLRLVSNILNAKDINSMPQVHRSASVENILSGEKTTTAVPSTVQLTYTPRVHRERGIPVANIRHRRSRSAGDKWLEHRAKNPVPVDTILQPYLKNRKSVTKLTDVNDIANAKTSKYCLVAQEADTDGELETKLYKGNVIPTCGGGAQVIFNDVECLKQISPTTSPNRKRPNTATTDTQLQDVASKCTISIEGHSTKRPKV